MNIKQNKSMSVSKPLLSIVTIHYNDIAGLYLTYQSLFKTIKNKNIEWIIVDGGTDFTEQPIYDSLVSDSTVFISEPDEGIYDAMNKGLANCNGDYTLFMNAGDSLLLENIEHDLRKEFDIFAFNSTEGVAIEQGKLKFARTERYIWWGMPTHHQALIIKTDKLKCFGFDCSLKVASDYKNLCQLIKEDSTYIVINKTLCHFDTSGFSSNNFILGLVEQQSIRENVLKISPTINYLIKLFKISVFMAKKLLPKVYERIRYVS